jgi:hypothetical protein
MLDYAFGKLPLSKMRSQLARMNPTRLLIDIPDDRHWVVGGIIY